MPLIIDRRGESINQGMLDVNINYDYPEGLDLRPGSDLHDKLVATLLRMARESHEALLNIYPTWRDIDKTVTAYIAPDTEEQSITALDARKPVSIVVPISYSVREILLSFWVAAFLDMPVFRYSGYEDSDMLAGMLLEKLIEVQTIGSKMPLSLYVMWKDAMTYGFGVVATTWRTKSGFHTIKQPTPIYDPMSGSLQMSFERIREEAILYEGASMENIDPYTYLPDPNVPIHDPQKGQYVGWIQRETYSALKAAEASGDFFNVEYLKFLDGRSNLYEEAKNENRREERFGGRPVLGDLAGSKPCDTIYIYADIIPEMWGLSSYSGIQKWAFALSGDKIITMAKPAQLDHNDFPVAVCVPDFDGYSVMPVSKLSIIYGLQHVMNWEFNSHVTNVRKALNDMIVYDPSVINTNDLKSPAPGKLIRSRKALWGRGKLQDSIFQLAVNDVTQNNIRDASVLTQMAQMMSGAVDSVSGVDRQGSERVSANEFVGRHTSALSRIEKDARIGSLMAHQDIAYQIAVLNQQLLNNDHYVEITGRYEQDLRREYGMDSRSAKVTPLDILVRFNVVPHDASIPTGDSAQVWVQLYQIITQNPYLMQQIDSFKLFKHIARKLGARNLNEFLSSPGTVAPSVQQPEVIDQQVQQGNLVPVGETNDQYA